MEYKIYDIVTDLIRHDITKSEAIDKLLFLQNVSNCHACGTKVGKVYCDVCVCKGLEAYEQ